LAQANQPAIKAAPVILVQYQQLVAAQAEFGIVQLQDARAEVAVVVVQHRQAGVVLE
jgi:hypothetical protein